MLMAVESLFAKMLVHSWPHRLCSQGRQCLWQLSFYILLGKLQLNIWPLFRNRTFSWLLRLLLWLLCSSMYQFESTVGI